MLQYELVLLPHDAERAPVGLPRRDGMILHPTAASPVVEVIARIHSPIQGVQDGTGDSDTGGGGAQVGG